MPSTLDLRRRIKSVKNTSQITKAMQMVAAAKMRKAQAAALAGRPYQETLSRVLAALRGRVDSALHPLIADFELKDPIAFSEVRPIARFIADKFISGEADQVRVLYPKFVNTLTQQSVLRTLLPIPVEELDLGGQQAGGEALFEPDVSSVLDAILPHYVTFQLFQMALNARASEHSARMVAMKTATDNAKQLIKDLTLEYNKVRQANITTELLEITTAQLAVG